MISYEQIKPYIEKKLISEQAHPEDSDVRIFNYTPECQFSRAWDDITTQCRGLIMNVRTGEILARPFPKFFNYQEHVEKGLSIPNEVPIITEKYDGSLGILYTLNGKTKIATRGSFTSDQAIWATNWWKENKGDEPYGNDITFLVEIIYPENRIVVNYDFSGLVYLASIDTKTGNQIDVRLPIKSVQNLSASMPLEELAKLDQPNSEGFVVFFPKANLRLKIKFPEYVRLHKILTGLSEIGIWELLKDGKGIDDLIKDVPDEFFAWVKSVKERLINDYRQIEYIATNEFREIYRSFDKSIDGGGGWYRKEWALEILKMKNPGIGFRMLDKEDYSQIIWKMIRPHGISGFKKDIDL